MTVKAGHRVVRTPLPLQPPECLDESSSKLLVVVGDTGLLPKVNSRRTLCRDWWISFDYAASKGGAATAEALDYGKPCPFGGIIGRPRHTSRGR